MLFIGAGAFALGIAIHNEAHAQQHAPRLEQIYYCAAGVEMPAFEPCKEMKGQRGHLMAASNHIYLGRRRALRNPAFRHDV